MFEFRKSKYQSNNTLAVAVMEGDELYCMLTVNLDYDPKEKYEGNDYAQFVDSNNCPQEIINQLVEEKKITLTPVLRNSGFCTYSLFDFNKEWIDSMKEME